MNNSFTYNWLCVTPLATYNMLINTLTKYPSPMAL
jgi:hypothetical protein